ncbi:MAG: hypothetical protein ACREJW_00115 [Candidatus Methylomirabilales bacterium]
MTPQLTEPPTATELAINALTESEMLSRLAELKEQGPRGLGFLELEELCAIYNRLRRGTSGPPKAPTAKSRKRRAASLPEDLSDLSFD